MGLIYKPEKYTNPALNISIININKTRINHNILGIIFFKPHYLLKKYPDTANPKIQTIEITQARKKIIFFKFI